MSGRATHSHPLPRRARSSIVEQTPILRCALEDARHRLPEGSHVDETTDVMADYTLRFRFVTEYDQSLCPPQLPPFAVTNGDWNAFLSDGDAADEVRAALAKHFALLSDVYAGKYK